MTNNISLNTWNTALGLILGKSKGKEGVSLSINNRPIDVNRALDDLDTYSLNINNDGDEQTLRALDYDIGQSSPHEFIEWDDSTREGELHVWIWTADNAQYNWLKENTRVPYSEGIFRVLPDKTLYVGSIQDASSLVFNSGMYKH